jgi:hypothetical protein
LRSENRTGALAIEAVVMCMSEGNAAQRKLLRGSQTQQTIANMGYARLKHAR